MQSTRRSNSDISKYKIIHQHEDGEAPDILPITPSPTKGKSRAKSEQDKPVETMAGKPKAKGEQDKPVETMAGKPKAKNESDKLADSSAAKPKVKSDQVERPTSAQHSHQRKLSSSLGRDHQTLIPKPSPQPGPPSPRRHAKVEAASKSVPTSTGSSSKGNMAPRQRSLESAQYNTTSVIKRGSSDDRMEDMQSLKPKSSPSAVSPASPQTGKSLCSAPMVTKQPVGGAQMAAGKSKLPVPVSSLQGTGATLQHTGVKMTQAQNLVARTEKALKTRLYLMQKTGPATFMVSGDNLENKYRVTIGPQVSFDCTLDQGFCVGLYFGPVCTAYYNMGWLNGASECIAVGTTEVLLHLQVEEGSLMCTVGCNVVLYV